jgi:cell division protein ZipA
MPQQTWIWIALAIAILVIVFIVLKIFKASQRHKLSLKIQRFDKDFMLSEAEDDIIGPARVINIEEAETSISEAEINLHAESTNAPSIKPKNWPNVMSLYIKAKAHEHFYGYDLLQAILNQGFIHGAKQFFHYSDGHRTLFSLASAEAPGTFDLEHMGGFKTTGICIFFQPPRFARPVVIFDQMVLIAQAITEELDGVLEDENHHLLTPERLNDWRSKLAD